MSLAGHCVKSLTSINAVVSLGLGLVQQSNSVSRTAYIASDFGGRFTLRRDYSLSALAPRAAVENYSENCY
jgi:hypothetical protein